MINNQQYILVIGNYPKLKTELYKQWPNSSFTVTFYAGRNSLGEEATLIMYNREILKQLSDYVTDAFIIDGHNNVYWQDFSTGDISLRGRFEQSVEGPEDGTSAPWDYDGARLVVGRPETSKRRPTVTWKLKELN